MHGSKKPSVPLVSQAEVRLGEILIRYEVVRSPRRKRTIEITVLPGKGVRVAAPLRTTDARIAEVVRARAAWILRILAKTPEEPKARTFEGGEPLHYLGRKVTLQVIPTDRSRVAVALRQGSLRVAVPGEHSAEEREPLVRAALMEWYKARALRRLTAAVKRWTAVMGLTASKVLVRDQRTLWGSCSADGTIRFNWRTVQVAPALMDYVVVHELAHLRYRSHGPRFWKEVARYIPDHKERRARLRAAGRELGW